MNRPLKPSQRRALAKLPSCKGNWIKGEMDGRKFILTQIPSRPVWEVTTPEGIQITVRRLSEKDKP